LEAPPEPGVKRAFIARSDPQADNRRMPSITPQRPWRHRPSATRAGLPALLLCALLAALPGPAAQASDHRDHERARAAVQAGEVLPLAVLLERLQRTHPGQVLELELERDDDAPAAGPRWIYEIKLLQASGQLLKLDVDAATGRVLDPRRKHAGRTTTPQDAPR
jgi:hypothetical protein